MCEKREHNIVNNIMKKNILLLWSTVNILPGSIRLVYEFLILSGKDVLRTPNTT